MKSATIEEIAYLLEQAKKNGLPKPIVFLGAGASKSGGIPLAREIVEHILARYSDNPKVKELPVENRTYSKLMDCLLPAERNKLLKEYIDEAKVNVTHIYLAQLITQGYIDYVLTVNFDNLMLRALSLYNYFPPTYDLAILKDLTTTSFPEKSVLYLHGQHHGLWLLNTEEEMNKVQEIVPPILNKITNGRAWIVIGYSGDDPIFNHIVKLGCFDNGLYWVGYNDTLPNNIVSKKLLDKPNTNASFISGYDADSFLIKLNSKIKSLSQPDIFYKPFFFLKKAIENIVDVDDKEHYNVVRQRMSIVKKQIANAISQFDEGVFEEGLINKHSIEVDHINKEIINKLISKDFIGIDEIARKVNEINNEELNKSLAELYIEWGVDIIDLSEHSIESSKMNMVTEAIEKYKKAVELHSESAIAYFEWGNALTDLANISKGENTERLYREAIEKYSIAKDFDPKFNSIYISWGYALTEIAKLKEGLECENLLNEAIFLYKKVIETEPHDSLVYSNWGAALFDIGKLKVGDEREILFNEAENKLLQSKRMGGSVYNLACLKALSNRKNEALELLGLALHNDEVSINYVLQDIDWKEFLNDIDFKNILNLN